MHFLSWSVTVFAPCFSTQEDKEGEISKNRFRAINFWLETGKSYGPEVNASELHL